MRTSAEAIFDAMVNEGWGDEVSGEVEAWTGHFVRISLTAEDARRALTEFSDVTSAYGTPELGDITGHFMVRTDDQGFIYVDRYDSAEELKKDFEAAAREYSKWAEGD